MVVLVSACRLDCYSLQQYQPHGASRNSNGSGATNVLPPEIALNVQNEISATRGVAVENIRIEKVKQKDRPNSCLGLPGANEVCSEVITPGWLLMFTINGQTYKYRVDKTGTVIRQEP